MLLEAGAGVVGAGAGEVAAGVHNLPGVVNLLVVLQVVLPPESPVADITREGFVLRVDEDVSLKLEFGRKLLDTACKKLILNFMIKMFWT